MILQPLAKNHSVCKEHNICNGKSKDAAPIPPSFPSSKDNDLANTHMKNIVNNSTPNGSIYLTESHFIKLHYF